MKGRFHQDYPASVDRLWRVFGTPDYPAQKYRAQGVTAFAIREFTRSDTQILLALDRTYTLPAERIPALVKKFLPARQTLHYDSRWERLSPALARFTLDIRPDDLPVTVRGEGELRDTGSAASRLTIGFEVSVQAALVARPAEAMILALIERSFRADHAFTLRYLADNA
mgnify:CR=1 FL=1